MNNPPFRWTRLAAALILSIGIAFVWGTLVIWSLVYIVQQWRPNGQTYETLQFTKDGTPVIVTGSFANYLETTMRTLDGRQLPNQRQEWLTPAYLPAPIEPPKLWESTVSWRDRLAGTGDTSPPISWYVVRNDRPVGSAYLIGYDEFARRPIGYFGRGGFRPTLPPDDEWFDLGRRLLSWGSGAVASTGHVQYGGRAVSYTSQFMDPRLPTSLLFLIDGERVVEINWRTQTSRILFESPQLVSLATLPLSPPSPANDRVAVEPNGDTQDTVQTANDAATENANTNTSSTLALVVHTTDQVVLLDVATDAKREFHLSESIPNVPLELYSVVGDQLLVGWRQTEGQFETELAWINPDGTFARREQVALATAQRSSELEATIMGTLAAPVPLASLGGVFVAAPVSMLQANRTQTYVEGVATALRYGGWLFLPISIGVAAALAAWTYHLQRKYHRPATGAWCAFVLLLGWPGFLAYWIEHRRPKLESCGGCGTNVPRDREACAACNTVFAPPPRLGTEIFA